MFSELWVAIKSSWSTGGVKYFRHNLSCELRRGRYEECYDYKPTISNRILFSLGVFLMDPLGRYHGMMCRHQMRFGQTSVSMSDTQWQRHPMPWVRRRAIRQISWMNSGRSTTE